MRGCGVPSPRPERKAVGRLPAAQSPQCSHCCCCCHLPQLLRQGSSVDPDPVTYRCGEAMPHSDWLKMPWQLMIGYRCVGSACPSGRSSTGWWQQLCEGAGPRLVLGGITGEQPLFQRSQPHVTRPHRLSSRFCCGFTSGQLVYIAQSVDLPSF